MFGPQPRFSVVVAETDGALIGMATLVERYSPAWVGPLFAIDDVFVTPDRRRRGVGMALLARVGAEALRRGASPAMRSFPSGKRCRPSSARPRADGARPADAFVGRALLAFHYLVFGPLPVVGADRGSGSASACCRCVLRIGSVSPAHFFRSGWSPLWA
jgi:hypothetical protein